MVCFLCCSRTSVVRGMGNRSNVFMLFVQEQLSVNQHEMNSLRQVVSEKDQESRKHQSLLDAKLQELEQMKSGQCEEGFSCFLLMGVSREACVLMQYSFVSPLIASVRKRDHCFMPSIIPSTEDGRINLNFLSVRLSSYDFIASTLRIFYANLFTGHVIFWLCAYYLTEI